MSVDGKFKRLTAKDRLCAAVLKAVRENDTAALRRLGLGGFAQYAGRLSELMTASVRGGLDYSPDFAALMRQVNSPVRYAHHLVNECGAAVQTALDERNGLRLRVVQPEYNDGRTKAIVGEAAESDSEHAADNLATQLGTEVKDAGNEFMKQNAEQRSGAGFKVTVERTGGTNCCPWCADRIGRWELKDAPDDVFGVHDNCTCMVAYTNSRGVRSQRLGRSRFVEVNYTPTRLTDGAERGAGEPKRLTGGANGGIIKPIGLFYKAGDDPMFEAFGRAEDSNPAELSELIKKLADIGVTITYHNDENSALAYQNIRLGEPGNISVNPNASYSAWLHEAQHAFDDKDAGWNACLAAFDVEEHIRREKRAYQKEIDLANELGRPDIAKKLEQNLTNEIRDIKRRDEMYAKEFESYQNGGK